MDTVKGGRPTKSLSQDEVTEIEPLNVSQN